MDAGPYGALGRLLTSVEAGTLAARLEDGDTLSQAMQAVARARQAEVRQAFEACDARTAERDVLVAVLRAIEGASGRVTAVSPIWTLPGYLPGYGALTGSIRELVLAARTSVVCSTYNFQRSSALWDALREVALRGTVEVRMFLDAEIASGKTWAPDCEEVAAHLPGAQVYRTRTVGDRIVRNHAKFLAVDHRFLVVTSANFSASAEQHNVELGLRVDSTGLVGIVERQLEEILPTVYERM